MAMLLQCITCNSPVSENAKQCPHCGEPSFAGMRACSHCEGNGYTKESHKGETTRNWKPSTSENAYDVECSRTYGETYTTYETRSESCPHCDGGIDRNPYDEYETRSCGHCSGGVRDVRYSTERREYPNGAYLYTYKKKCLYCNGTGLVRAIYLQKT